MINFFVGKADVDITGRIRHEIAGLLRGSTDRKIIFIVPEQFEYETERAVYKLLKSEKLLYKMSAIEITTFTALSSGIISESGVNRPRADEIVKNVLMHKAVDECNGSLTALANISGKAGFCEKLTATVTGFKSLGLSYTDLERSVEKLGKVAEIAEKNPVVLNKLADVSMLYTHYDALMEKNGYLDSLDVIGLAADLVRKSKKFKDADVFVDSFNDFTNHQLRFLCEIIPIAKSVTFGFVTDYHNDEKEVFKTANSHINRLIEKAENEGISPSIITSGMKLRFSDNLALSELPRLLFQDGKSSKNQVSECELISAVDIYEELDFVCSRIKQLVDEKNGGMRYRDIAVLCTDLGACGRYIESAFKKYDIPIFLDMRESILSQPLINAVIMLINALRDFSVDTVMSCVKTKFFTKLNNNKEQNKNERRNRVGLSDSDINVFEDYIFEWALDTGHLKKPFTFQSGIKTNNQQETDSGSEPETDPAPDTRLETAENIRKSIAMPLWKLSEELHKEAKTDGALLTEKIYNCLINTLQLNDELIAKCMMPSGEGKEMDEDRTMLYQRLLDTLMKIFDTLHIELKGFKLTIDDYYKLFRDICAGTTLANPPQMADRVLVGDIDRTRADNVKAAFIVGASFDMFPTPAPQKGIFSQYETELLYEKVAHIIDDNKTELCLKSAKEQYLLSLYRAYRAVCLPTEYLCLSWSENSVTGEPLQPSAVCEDIKEIFGLEFKKASDFDDEFYCRSVNAAKLRFALSINSGTEENEVLKMALRESKCGDFVDKLEEIKNDLNIVNNSDEPGKHKLTPETATLLFPTRVGATEIESMSKCRFSFFCEKGLGITQKTQRNFNRLKRGDAVHYILENVLKTYSADIVKFCGLSRYELYGLSREHLRDYIRKETNGLFIEDSRSKYLFNNLANTAADVMITMQTEFHLRSYRPKFFELSLRENATRDVISSGNDKILTPPAAALFFEKDFDPDTFDINKLIPNDTAVTPSGLTINTAPLRLTLNNGSVLTVSGRIDRLDMFTDGINNYVRAVDFKSSVHAFDIENAKRGINIQMLLYLGALLDANPDTLTAGGISYIPSKNNGAQSTGTSPFRLLALSHRPSGLVVTSDAAEKEYNKYSSDIIDKIIEGDNMTEKRKDAAALSDKERKELEEYNSAIDNIRSMISLNEKNSLSPEDFGSFLDEVKSSVAKRYSEMLNGDINALPLEYTEEIFRLNEIKPKQRIPCKYCRFGSICKNAGKKTDPVKAKENDTGNNDQQGTGGE